MNNLLTYFIKDGNSDGLFLLYPNGTLYILQHLDREKQSQHRLTIIALDSGTELLTFLVYVFLLFWLPVWIKSTTRGAIFFLFKLLHLTPGLPPLTGTGTILVVVNDANDNRPVFDYEKFDSIVLEDSPVGTVFARITASDDDVALNGQIR